MKIILLKCLGFLIIFHLIIRFRGKILNLLLKNKALRYYTIAYVNEWDAISQD